MLQVRARSRLSRGKDLEHQSVVTRASRLVDAESRRQSYGRSVNVNGSCTIVRTLRPPISPGLKR